MIEAFREGMRRLAGAVTIITTGEGDSATGLTATAVCSLSMEPPRLLACVNRFGSTFRALAPGARYVVNLLPAAGQEMAERFAGRTGLTGAERFGTEWHVEAGFPPRLPAAISSIACRVHSMTLVETHAIVIGEVEQVWNGSEQAPLVYHRQEFATVCPLG